MAFDIDSRPQTDIDKNAIKSIVLAQTKEAMPAWDVKVTCPCGTSVKMLMACRCLYCGVYFCQKCAKRHFQAQHN